MPSVSSAAMLHFPSPALRTCPLVSTQNDDRYLSSIGRESSLQLSRSRLQARSWSCFGQSSACGCNHLIVSLGIISKPKELVIIEVAVFLLVAQALVINRMAGLPYPFGDMRGLKQDMAISSLLC